MKNILLSLMLLLLTSCSTLQFSKPPELVSKAFDSRQAEICAQSYVQGGWQFVHSITFKMTNGHGATVIGVTVLDGDILKTGLMGVEGFVLFEAELDAQKKLDVKRALPPFDNLEFAKGLMRDVQTIFSLPTDTNPVTGMLADGEVVCRYYDDRDQITDVLIEPDETRRIHVYDEDKNKIRTIEMDGYSQIETEMIPEQIYFTAHGLRGYTLKMTLISADKI
ncbi:MAG: hypothetical protein KAR01_09795 [Desulfocapsa sp.]|nr:hypothetical protein [Desulfocapsa sp.]